MVDVASVVDIRTVQRADRDKAPLVKFYLFGAMRIVGPTGESLLPRLKKTRALLAYLCLADGAFVPRSRLIGLLWALSGEQQALVSLRQALAELKSTVGNKIPGLIEISREAVRLNPGAYWIDAIADQGYSERLLEDLDGISTEFDHWLTVERTRHENQHRSRLEHELDRLIEAGAPPNVRIEAARKLVNFDPVHEGAARSLISAFVELGDRAQARREFERCRETLKKLADLSPSPETVGLYEALRLTRTPAATLARIAPRNAPIGSAIPSVAADAAASVAGDQASIAVLPFRNLSGVPEHGYAGDGLAEDLIEVLARIPNLFVISRLSTIAFRNEDRLPQEIGEVLGVKYVLSGSMRVLGERLRLSVELTETQRGTALWSQRIDERFYDLFEVQDRLVDAIVRRIAPYVHQAELTRTRVKRGDRLHAYDLFLRAVENMHNSSRAVFDSSERLFQEAIARQSNYAAALAWLAYWHVLRVGQGWSPDVIHDAAQADDYATRAVETDKTEPMALAVHGHIAAYLHKDFDLAFKRFKAALAINPNAAPAWLWQAAARSWAGEGANAIEDINRAKALSPYDPLMYAYSTVEGMSYLADSQYPRAVECAYRSIQENKTYTSAYRLLIIALTFMDRANDARAHVSRLLDLEPDLTVERFRDRYPGSASPNADLYCEALAKAGVPLTG